MRFTGQTVEESSGWGRLAAIHPDDVAHLGRWLKAIVARPRSRASTVSGATTANGDTWHS